MTFMSRFNVRDLRSAIRAVVVALVAAMALSVSLAPTPARADDGTILRTITAQVPPCNLSTGIAYDGTSLSLTCWQSPNIWFVSPADGHLISTYVPTNSTVGLGAIAYDRKRGTYWACTRTSPERVVELTLDPSSHTYSSRNAFTTADGCIDGLAYDGTDDTLFVSGDVRPNIYHYTTTGQQLAVRDISGQLGDCLSSGLAVGGQWLFMSNNGCSQIYRSPKNNGDTPTLFATYPERLEDMECDDITFASTGKAVIWSKDAYDPVLNAFELNPGDCGYGGQPEGTMVVKPGYQQRYLGGAATVTLPGPFDVLNPTPARAEVVSGPNLGRAWTFTCVTSCNVFGSMTRDYEFRAAPTASVGTDMLRIWIDKDNDGARDAAEPFGLAYIKWNRPIDAVGLGDSYSSGEGVNPYDQGTDVDAPLPGGTAMNQCHRSAFAYSRHMTPVGYPEPLARIASAGPPTTFSLVACASAITKNVNTNGYAQYNEGATQLNQGKVTSATDLVVLTLGGNDINFSEVVTLCGEFACLDGNHSLDGRPVMDWVSDRITELPAKLVETLGQVKAAAPNATVVLMGYPRLFPATASEQSCPSLIPFGGGEMPAMNTAANNLDAAMRSAAAQAGVHYVSSINTWAGHEVCGVQGAWLNGTTMPALNDWFRKQWVGTGSFHPNKTGQITGYTGQLDSFLKRASETLPTFDTGLPKNPTPVAQLAAATTAIPTTLKLGRLHINSRTGTTATTCLDDGLVQPGSTIRVAGDGYASGASVPITLETSGVAPVTLATLVANSQGAILGNVTLPVRAVDTTGLLRAKAAGSSARGGGTLELLTAIGFARTCPSAANFTGFWVSQFWDQGNVGDYTEELTTPGYVTFGFELRDASGQRITDPAAIIGSQWETYHPQAAPSTPVYNTTKQRFEITSYAPKAWSDTTHVLTVTLADGSKHSITAFFSIV